jgi:chromosome segregation ATPase
MKVVGYMDDEVERILREADRHRNATAVLSREFSTHVGLKRELDDTARRLQTRLDVHVRRTAEETHQLTAELRDVKRDYRLLQEEVTDLRLACEHAQRLCLDAKLKRDQLTNHLRGVKAETDSVAAGLALYLDRTKANLEPLERQLIGATADLAALHEERLHLEHV